MFSIFGWIFFIIFGLIAGLLAKLIHPGDKEPQGVLATTCLGIFGSYLGGFIGWMLGWVSSPLTSSGIIMSIVGGVILCWLYGQYVDGNVHLYFEKIKSYFKNNV